jgi:deazaflavin-dependent oxidoreductase (nitroreductase family)
LLLTTDGRSSGQPRTTPLIFRSDGERFVVVASKAARRSTRAGTRTSRPPPGALIEVKGEEIPVRATTAHGAERERPWRLLTEVWPAYDDYQKRTEREIPVVVLSRR